MTGTTNILFQLPDPPPGKTCWPWTDAPEPVPEKMLDGTPWPKISVVTPSYNQGQFIEETIRSVLLQCYPNLEYIIIDGGSTDNTLEIIKKYEHWLAYWESVPDRGQSHAVNKGIRKATGEILFWLNSDDLVLPGAFKRVADEFIICQNVCLLIGQAQIINSCGLLIGELRPSFITWEETATNPRNSIRQISSFFSRTIFDELGYLDETLHIAMDTELMVRFSKQYIPIIIDEFLTAYRQHPGAKTSSQLIRGYTETDRIRLQILEDKDFKKKYRKRSANNWLSLVESQNFEKSARVHCLFRAIKINPGIVFAYRFWTAARKILSLGSNIL